jgi:hypothetical protein
MDFISENLIFAVFIAIAIVSQIGRLLIRRAEKRKREEHRERAEERREAAVYSGYEAGEDAEDEDGDADEAFSAWALSVDDEAGSAVRVSPPPAAVPRPVAVPFSAPLSAASSSFPFLIANSALGAEKHGAERPIPPSVPEEGGPLIYGNGRGKARSNAGLKRSAVSAGFPGKLDYLPPLKRAVVLAEILGPPKGF